MAKNETVVAGNSVRPSVHVQERNKDKPNDTLIENAQERGIQK